MLVSASTSQACAASVCNLRAPCGRRCDLDPARLPRRLAGRAAWHCPRMLPPRHGAQCTRAAILPRGCPWRGGRSSQSFPPVHAQTECAAWKPAGRAWAGRDGQGDAGPAGMGHCRVSIGRGSGGALQPVSRMAAAARAASSPPLRRQPGACAVPGAGRRPRQAYFSSHTAAARPRVKYRPAGRAP